MARAIAVFVGENGETAALEQPGTIILYQKNQGRWQELRAKEFSLGEVRSLRELRAALAEIMNHLQECKIFVGRSITGLPCFALEKAGCSVWEFAGRPEDFLDYILSWEEVVPENSADESSPLPMPEDLGNGRLRISIKEIQETDRGVTSKQALQPILRRTDFTQLEVLCSHIPPWLETETMLGGLVCISTTPGQDGMSVVIEKPGTRE